MSDQILMLSSEVLWNWTSYISRHGNMYQQITLQSTMVDQIRDAIQQRIRNHIVVSRDDIIIIMQPVQVATIRVADGEVIMHNIGNSEEVTLDLADPNTDTESIALTALQVAGSVIIKYSNGRFHGNGHPEVRNVTVREAGVSGGNTLIVNEWVQSRVKDGLGNIA